MWHFAQSSLCSLFSNHLPCYPPGYTPPGGGEEGEEEEKEEGGGRRGGGGEREFTRVQYNEVAMVPRSCPCPVR